jgi:colicin import membrane protein
LQVEEAVAASAVAEAVAAAEAQLQREQKVALEAQLAEEQQARQGLTVEVQRLEKDRQDKWDLATRLEGEVGELKGQIEYIERVSGEMLELRGAYKEKEEAVRQLEEAVRQLRADAAARDEDLAGSRSVSERLRQELDAALWQLQEAEKKLADEQEAARGSEAATEQLRIEAAELRRENDRLNCAAEEQTRDAGREDRTVEEAENRLADVQVCSPLQCTAAMS